MGAAFAQVHLGVISISFPVKLPFFLKDPSCHIDTVRIFDRIPACHKGLESARSRLRQEGGQRCPMIRATARAVAGPSRSSRWEAVRF